MLFSPDWIAHFLDLEAEVNERVIEIARWLLELDTNTSHAAVRFGEYNLDEEVVAVQYTKPSEERESILLYPTSLLFCQTKDEIREKFRDFLSVGSRNRDFLLMPPQGHFRGRTKLTSTVH